MDFYHVLLLIMGSLIVEIDCYLSFSERHWLPDFAVEIEGNKDVADLVAEIHGFYVILQTNSTPSFLHGTHLYHFHHNSLCESQHRCKRQALRLEELLQADPNVRRVEQQFLLKRVKRFKKANKIAKVDGNDPLLKAIYRRNLHINKITMDIIKRNPDLYNKREANDLREYNQEVLKRTTIALNKGFYFNDPQFSDQWYLLNDGQAELNPGLDINILPAWTQGYAGQGVVISVVDDGVDTKHKDLNGRIDLRASADYNDPMDYISDPRGPGIMTSQDGHGTMCAGVIGAIANNNVCGSGLAFKVNLGGIRILAGPVTDLMEAYALLHNNQYISVYSCSWGPSDDGETMEMPNYYSGRALTHGVEHGRGGKGSIFVFAGGNGGRLGDSCGADGYVNSPYTIAVSAVDIYGFPASYAEPCSSIIAVLPVGGSDHPFMGQDPKMTTSSINNGCSNSFDGTSAATPLASACIALALEANENLGWRDVQHLMAISSRLPTRFHDDWQRNAAGYHYHPKLGFGLLDCSRMVTNAQIWQNVGPRKNCTAGTHSNLNRTLLTGSSVVFHFVSDGCINDSGKHVSSLEHVTVTLVVSTKSRGSIELILIAPSGTRAMLLATRFRDKKSKGEFRQLFTSLSMWGEAPFGLWTLLIRDTGYRVNRVSATVKDVHLVLYGSSDEPSSLPFVVRDFKYDANGKSLAGRKSSTRKDRRMSLLDAYETFDYERNLALRVFPVKRSVHELKKRILDASHLGVSNNSLVSAARSLILNDKVTKDEIAEVLNVVEEEIRRLKKS